MAVLSPLEVSPEFVDTAPVTLAQILPYMKKHGVRVDPASALACYYSAVATIVNVDAFSAKEYGDRVADTGGKEWLL
jgi:hypothetical protein